jgi:hypothetical protein
VTVPGAPKNPIFLLGDSDVVVQILITGLTPKLHLFRREYGIQPVITEAVDSELPGLLRARFADRLAGFDKALRVRSIVVLTEEYLSGPCGDKASIVYERLNALGDQLSEVGIGRGEAYSHAAGIHLRVPVVSNDKEALHRLRSAAAGCPDHVFRFFDLVVFLHQIGELSTSECNNIRQQLIGRDEHVPACFAGHSFEDGLLHFFPRLLDSDFEYIGSRTAVDARLDRTLYIRRPQCVARA